MKDYIIIGSSPYGEGCAQVGQVNYSTVSQAELVELRRMMLNSCGQRPEGCDMVVKSFPHDFGRYHELCVTFDPEIESEEEYALMAEQLPEEWDEEAKTKLREIYSVVGRADSRDYDFASESNFDRF